MMMSDKLCILARRGLSSEQEHQHWLGVCHGLADKLASLAREYEARNEAAVLTSIERTEVALAQGKNHIETALAALNTLDSHSLTEVRSVGKPPGEVIKLMCCVMALVGPVSSEHKWKHGPHLEKIILSKSEAAWKLVKVQLRNILHFVRQVQELDIGSVDALVVALVEKCLDDDSSLLPESLVNSSYAAAAFAKWTMSILEYRKFWLQANALHLQYLQLTLPPTQFRETATQFAELERRTVETMEQVARSRMLADETEGYGLLITELKKVVPARVSTPQAAKSTPLKRINGPSTLSTKRR